MTLLAGLVLIALAFANGANDTVKPVASLIGAGRVHPRRALAVSGPVVTVASEADCRQRDTGAFVGVSAHRVAGARHWGSALLVCFARGLQDGAKIAGIGLVLLGSA